MKYLLLARSAAASLTLAVASLLASAVPARAAPLPQSISLTAMPIVPTAVPVVPETALPVGSAASGETAPAVSPSGPVTARPVKPRTLHDLVVSFVDYGNHEAEMECLATAVYFEARGESLEGQLAVAQVVMNRAASGLYPSSVCSVITQPVQFSFVRRGRFPRIDRTSNHWHKALAIADIARKRLMQQVASNVLWYHAEYVSPAWGQRLTRVAKIGAHIFYQ